MPCVTVDLSNVDWGLLRKQKLSLLKAVKIRAKTGASESAEHLRGNGAGLGRRTTLKFSCLWRDI